MVVVRWLSALRPYRDVEELPTARKIQVITSRSLGGYGAVVLCEAEACDDR